MKHSITICVSSFLSLWTIACCAYEPSTHAELSDFAASNSVLNSTVSTPTISTTVLQDLGIDGYDGDEFPDNQSGQKVDSGPGLFPSKFQASSSGTVQDLIIAGAELEDANDRSFCHFYDPNFGDVAPLDFTLAGNEFTASFAAPQWATGSSDSTLTTPITGTCNIPGISNLPGFTSEQQDYSLVKANQYFYDALTKQNKSDREQGFGDLFLSIGHVLHLLEDMGQPQHVRDDMHCDSPGCILIGHYAPSEYEKYAYRNYDTTGPDFTKTPDYPVAQDFWSTGDQKGLAEYTNMNFASVGTMDSLTAPYSGKYSMPTPSGDTNVDIHDVFTYITGSPLLPSQIDSYCQSRSCTMTFITSDVYDANIPSNTSNPWAASQSIFNADLNDVNNHQFYALNAATYKSTESFVFPKMEAYSAGLINHFFRGRLNVTYDQTQPNSYVVTNVSSYAMQNGTLSVYYDAADGTRTLVPGATYPSQNLDAYCTSGCNDSTTITFQPPTDPAPAAANQYMFVYQGTIGTEPGVAGFQIKPPVLNLNFLIGDQVNFDSQSGHYAATEVETVDSNGNVMGGVGVNNPCPTINTFVCFYPLPPEQLAVYNGTVYTGSHYGVTSYVASSIPTEFAYYLNSGFVGGVAANNSGIYVLYSNNSGLAVDVYDHAKQQKQQTININVSGASVPGLYNPSSLSNINGLNGISVNNSRMCIVYMTQTGSVFSETAILTDLQGNVISTLATAITQGQSSNNQIACTSTGNRQYVIVSTVQSPLGTNPATLYVFDNNGISVSTIVVNGGPFNSIAATDNTIYLLPDVSPPMASITVLVLNRVVTRNGTTITSENITPASSNLVIQTPTWDYSDISYEWPGTAIAFDSYGALNEPVQ